MNRVSNTTEPSNWQPQVIERVVKIHQTNMKPAEVMTDAGAAYVKYLGGCNAGPHPLACEWIGSNLSRWFGLPTPDFALLELDDLSVELLQEADVKIEPGTAFMSRKLEQATNWDGLKESLENVENVAIIPALVLFDMWTLNWDRCPPDDRRENLDNLLIVGDKTRKRKSLLVPIDYGQCFVKNSEITSNCAIINRVKDEQVYGLFEAFRPYMLPELIAQAAGKLQEVDETEIRRLAEQIPKEWKVDASARDALIQLICSRAAYLADDGLELLKHSNNELF